MVERVRPGNPDWRPPSGGFLLSCTPGMVALIEEFDDKALMATMMGTHPTMSRQTCCRLSGLIFGSDKKCSIFRYVHHHSISSYVCPTAQTVRALCILPILSSAVGRK